MSEILKSKPLIEDKIISLKKSCEELKAKGTYPFLKVILVGSHPPSIIYTNNKKKFCERIGAKAEIIKLSEDINKDDFCQIIEDINLDKNVHGCLIQLPLPKQLQELDVSNLIVPEKDVDGFCQHNQFRILQNSDKDDFLSPCTPKGIISLLKYYKISLAGKKVTVIGRSMIVGKPVSLLLNNENATVTLCHSKTKNLREHTQQADIIISASGQPEFLDSTYLSDDKKPIIVDVGISYNDKGTLCGDVDFQNVINHVSAITPVPGGVGPMTIFSLVENLMTAAARQTK